VMYFDPALFYCIPLGHALKVLLMALWTYLLANLRVSYAILPLSSYFCNILDWRYLLKFVDTFHFSTKLTEQ
jgi:hypothetical protein